MLVKTFRRPTGRTKGWTEEESNGSTELLLDCSPNRMAVSGGGERKARKVKKRWEGERKRMETGRRREGEGGDNYGKEIEKGKDRGRIWE